MLTVLFYFYILIFKFCLYIAGSSTGEGKSLEQSESERRKYKRFNIISFVYSPGGDLLGYTRDLSIGGACINLVSTFDCADDMKTHIIIKPVTDKYNLGDINIITHHVWGNIQPEEKGNLIGVQFKESPVVTERIEEMISYFYGEQNIQNPTSLLN